MVGFNIDLSKTDVSRALSTGSTFSEKHMVTRWYYDPRSLILAITVLVVAFTLPAWRLFNDNFNWCHPALAAVMGGIFTALVAYPITIWCDPKYGLSTAVLLGLVCASFGVYGFPLRGEVVAPLLIAFYAFHVFFGYSEADKVDPPLYRAYVQGNEHAVPEDNIAPIAKELQLEAIDDFERQKIARKEERE